MVTIDTAYTWLNQFDRSRLPQAVRVLEEQIETALERRDLARAEALINRLLKYCENGTDESAEARLLCARYLYRLSRLEQAARLLHHARFAFLPDHHRAAVAQWMEGCVLWDMPEDQRFFAPSQIWQESRDAFESLGKNNALPAERAIWYLQRLAEMDQALNVKIRSELNGPASIPPTGNGDGGAAAASGGTASPAASASPAARNKAGFLETFKVIDQIPAGGFAPVGFDPNEIGTVEITEVMLDGRPHRVFNLVDASRAVNLLPYLRAGENLVVLRVYGDSMDQANIDSGDFVLLRQVTDGQHNDIVAAEIIDEDDRATLKRLRIDSRGRYILIPESSNPAHRERPFSQKDNEFHIRGVAVAVFKPMRADRAERSS